MNESNNVIFFDEHGIEGCFVLKGIADDGKYIYEMFYLNKAEDSGEYFFGIKVSDGPITELVQPTVEYTFDKTVVECLVRNNDVAIINKAKDLNAEVYGEEYRQNSSYRGNDPWASIDDAVELAKKEIADGKEKEDVIELMINKALSTSKKAR